MLCMFVNDFGHNSIVVLLSFRVIMTSAIVDYQSSSSGMICYAWVEKRSLPFLQIVKVDLILHGDYSRRMTEGRLKY